MKTLYENYFDDWEVRPEFSKEFVSLWSGWLGDEIHKLDEVTEEEWGRFNNFVRAVARDYQIMTAHHDEKMLSTIESIGSALADYDTSMEKDESKFSQFVIPELDCVITEEWDYTYIIWHKNNDDLNALIPLISAAGLKHFSD